MDVRSGPDYRLDEITVSDLAELAVIEATLFSDPWSAAGFLGALEAPGGFLRCARERGSDTILGYVVAWFAADEGEIANLAVRREGQRRGIGRALLGTVIDAAPAAGARAVYLEVRESNVAARALYGTSGFEEIGRRRGYYERPREDGMVLRRGVSPSATK